MNRAGLAVQSATPPQRGGFWHPLRMRAVCGTLRQDFRFVTVTIERASYNGSIEASQALDAGSIPAARSRL
jgi:hypothetical protein